MGGNALPSGIRPPADPKGPPFDTFSESIKGGPIYSNFEKERAPKKPPKLSKFFKKCPKTAFLTVFSKICLRRRKFSQNRGKTVLWDGRARKINLVDLKKKKKVVKILGNFFKNPPPPRENPRSAPAHS